MSKKISIIVPCYNVENYIDRCVKSLVTQSIGINELELILINDFSSDNTLEKLLHWEKQYPDSIIIIDSEKNLKQGGARNLGLQYASADYIGFVDSDDWVEQTMFEKLYHKAVQYDCDVVVCDFKRVADESTVMGTTGYKDSFFIIEDIESRKDLLISGLNSNSIWVRLYKRDLIFDNNIFFPEGLAYEDNFFSYFILLYVKRLYYVEEYLYHYYVNPNSTVTSQNSSHHFDRLAIETLKLEELRRRDLFQPFYHEIEFGYLLLYYFNTLHIIITRFSSIPLDIVNHMREEVIRNFPHYKDNPYIEQFLVNAYKSLLVTIDTPMDQSAWDQLTQNY